MKRVIAVICMMFSFAAFAADQKHSWFDLDIGEIGVNPNRVWPTDGSDYFAHKCVLTNTAAASFADSRIRFSADLPMTVVPDDMAAISDYEYVQVGATMKMEPFLENDVPAVPEGAKAAVIAVISGDATNFWVAAGTDELFWTNTCIAADVSEDVIVKAVFNNGRDGVVTKWTFNGNTEFTCKIVKVPDLHLVSFQGDGEVSSCWGDAEQFGDPVHFWIEGVDTNVIMVVATTNGDLIAQTDIGDYVYLSGSTVNLSFTLPDGWRFITGDTERRDVIDSLEAGGYTPFGGRGIMAVEIGPEDGWMLYYGVAEPLLAARFSESELEDAFSAMKDGMILDWCYSEKDRTFRFNEDGTVSVGDDPRQWAAKPRYHFVDIGIGVPSLSIDEEEATITSISQCDLDESSMSVGSVQNTFSGFDYSVIYADDVGFTEGLGETEPVKGNGEKLELTAPKGDAGKRFYRIRITD